MANPAYRDEGYYHSIRCSKNNPQHVYVHQVLDDLNTDIFKSKNQFMVDAIEYYSKSLNHEDLSATAASQRKGKERAENLTVEDLEQLKKEVVDEVMIRVQREVIAILGYAVGNRPVSYVAATAPEAVVKEEKKAEPEINPIVADMASLWAEDFGEEE